MMTETERQELLAANKELHRQRKQLAKSSLQPPSVQFVEAPVSDAERAYFEALNSGQDTGTEKHVETGRRQLWDAFESDRHPTLQSCVKTIARWYNDRLDNGGGIILAGNYGCGKSHLAKAVWELYGSGAIFWNERRLIETIQGGYGGNGRTEASIFNDIRRAKLLIYDDLGAYATTNYDWLQGVYYNLFDGRTEDSAAVFITTNLPLKTGAFEARVGGRVFSRIMGQIDSLDYWIDLFDVPDYRKRNFRRA